MVKVSKSARSRLKRMSSTERKQIHKAAVLLADNDCIKSKRYDAIIRVIK